MNADVIVLGVGGMGSAACYSLSSRGLKTIGLEQFDVGHDLASSHGQTRLIRKAYFEHPDYVPLLETAYRGWKDLEAAAGTAIYHETGLLYSCPEGSQVLAGVVESAARYDIPLVDLTNRDRSSLSGRFRIPSGHRVVLEPAAGYLEVETCVREYARLAEAKGAVIVPRVTVKSWQSNGRQVTVETTTGRYQADALVVTAGAWTSVLLRELGLPLTVLRKTMLWFAAPDAYAEERSTPCFFFEIDGAFFYGFPKLGETGVKIAEHSGGRVIEDPSNADRALDPDEWSRVQRFASACLPLVDTSSLLRYSPCMYTMTPDANFVVDVHPEHRNVVFAGGFSGHGFKFAPVIGEVLADLVSSGATEYPIEFLRRGVRFTLRG